MLDQQGLGVGDHVAELLALREVETGVVHSTTPRRLLIAGFTGRDQQDVEAHLSELRDLGVPVPDSTPIFVELDPGLLTTDGQISVGGAFTSGEVEPVVVVTADGWVLTVGSDHTDRDLERMSIPLSKEVCPKVLGSRCVRIDSIVDWDAVELTSWVDTEPEPYQSGVLRSLLPLTAILEHMHNRELHLKEGDVVFLGTLPVRGPLRPAGLFRGQLTVPDDGPTLQVDYTIQVDRPSSVEAE